MEFIKKIKEYLADPKKKALTQLGLYGIFFIFVFIFLNSGSNSTPNYSEYIEKEDNTTVSNYEYVYKINNNEVVNQITGTFKNNEDTFNYNNLNYTKKDGIVYFNNAPVENLNFDVDKYKYSKIEELIENNESKTTYKDTNKVVYSMNVNKYFDIMNEPENMVDTLDIQMTYTVESNDYIEYVLIDLSNYYEYKYTIEINYNNINAIE